MSAYYLLPIIGLWLIATGLRAMIECRADAARWRKGWSDDCR